MLTRIALLASLAFPAFCAIAQNDSVVKPQSLKVMDLARPFLSLEVGYSMLIPLSNYQISYGNDCFDCEVGNFQVQPTFTATNARVVLNYSGIIYKRKKSFIGTNTTIGFNHLERGNVKSGSYSGEFLNPFSGTIRTNQHEIQAVTYTGIRYAVALGQRLLLVNELGILFSYSFYTTRSYYEKRDGGGIEENFSVLKNSQTANLSLHYKLGVIARLNDRFWLTSFFEIPLISSSSFHSDSGLDTYEIGNRRTTTPYPTNINKATYLAFNVGVIIRLITLNDRKK